MFKWLLFYCRLYYARIGIGTPSKDYYVQVDTGSDIMWVNCIQCKECPRRSSLGVSLPFFFFIFLFFVFIKLYLVIAFTDYILRTFKLGFLK